LNVEEAEEEREEEEKQQPQQQHQQQRRTIRVSEKDRKPGKSTVVVCDKPTTLVMVGGTSTSDEDLAKHPSSMNASHARTDRGSSESASRSSRAYSCFTIKRRSVIGR